MPWYAGLGFLYVRSDLFGNKAVVREVPNDAPAYPDPLFPHGACEWVSYAWFPFTKPS